MELNIWYIFHLSLEVVFNPEKELDPENVHKAYFQKKSLTYLTLGRCFFSQDTRVKLTHTAVSEGNTGLKVTHKLKIRIWKRTVVCKMSWTFHCLEIIFSIKFLVTTNAMGSHSWPHGQRFVAVSQNHIQNLNKE